MSSGFLNYATTADFGRNTTVLRAALIVGAVLFLSLLAMSGERVVSLIALASLGFVSFYFAISSIAGFALRFRSKRMLEKVRALFERDLFPTYVFDTEGAAIWQNKAAQTTGQEGTADSSSIAQVFDQYLPNAHGLQQRLVAQLAMHGHSSERLHGRDNAVTVFAQTIGSYQLWRFDLRADNDVIPENDTAMLTVGRKGTILFMNRAARALIGERVKSLEQLFAAVPPQSGSEQTLSTKHGPVQVQLHEQRLQGERSHLFLTPVKAGETLAKFALADFPVPLLKLTEDGVIEEANDAARNLLGDTTYIARSMSEVFDAMGSDFTDLIANSALDLPQASTDFIKVKGAKNEVFVQLSLKRLGQGESATLIAVLSDATKLKSLEAQFVQSQKMQAIGQLAGGVAHDFNNLLTAISGHCDLMLLRHDSGDQDYADLMQIHQNANRAAALVSQLLAFSRKQTLKPETLDLRNTLSDLTHLLNRLVGEKVLLSLSHDPVLKSVKADKRQLEQVVMNLVVNARDAMPQGGEIAIETESLVLKKPLKRERVTVPEGDYVVVRVRDQGTGIEPEALQKIFEPFYTTKRTGEGTGLGLSTAYGIVKQTGGYIFADSEMGHGTCFSLLFPACESASANEHNVEPMIPLEQGTQCDGVILLVEDEAPVRAFASRALSMRGFKVIEAESAEQALDILQDKVLHVDLFVTDVVMPGMDGPTWVRQALKERPEVKIVFVSGYAEGAFRGKSPDLPNSTFLPKPFSLSDLTSTVQNQLN